MLNKLKGWVNQLFEEYLQLDRNYRLKILFLGFSYFCILGSYSILRSLKTSVFLGLVGKEYQPLTRLISFFLILPTMLIYEKLVDKLKRYQIVYTILGIYAIISLVFAFLFAHPSYGLKNSYTSPYRILGWAFEVFMDLYSALVVSTFWGFVNSICTPDFANKSYGLIVAIAKIGGIITPLLGLMLIQSSFESWHTIPFITLIASILLVTAIFLITALIKRVPSSYLIGYQVANTEIEVSTTETSTQIKKKPNLLEGLFLMLREPYVFGIFGLVYSVEIIAIIFDYQWQVLLSIQTNNHVGTMSSYMFIYTASFQALGFLFALLGPSMLLKKIGIRSCLMITPFASILLAISLLISPNLATVFFILVIIRALNYGFNFPVREILYIPTVKDVQFKSKAWIESFGKTFSKTSGSLFNLLTVSQHPYLCLYLNSFFTIGVGLIYSVISFLIGRKYMQTIAENKIIGKK